MNIKGKLIVIGDIKEFSNNFRKRDVVVETLDQYPQKISIEFVQDTAQMINNYKLGDIVDIDINIRGREWTNKEGVLKYFNTIQGWRIKSDVQQEMKEAVTNAQHNPDREPVQAADDLPF